MSDYSRPKYLSLSDTSKLTGISVYLLRKACHDNEIAYIRVGGNKRYMIDYHSLDEFYEKECR